VDRWPFSVSLSTRQNRGKKDLDNLIVRGYTGRGEKGASKGELDVGDFRGAREGKPKTLAVM